MKLPPSQANQIRTHNKQTHTHKQTYAPPTEQPSPQNSPAKPKLDADIKAKTLTQPINTTVRTLAAAPNNIHTQTQRIETSVTAITKLSAFDINRLTTLLPKEQLLNLAQTNSTTSTASLGINLLTLKTSHTQESLSAITKSGWQVGTKIHVELPAIATPKLFILEEKPFQSLSGSPTLSHTHKSMTSALSPHYKSDAEFTHITRKALVDVGLRKYLPQQIDRSLAGKAINQLISSKHPLAQANQNVHSTQVKQATADVIASLNQLEKTLVASAQTMTPVELKSAIKNSGTFLESHIKNNTAHTAETSPKHNTTTRSQESTTNTSVHSKNNNEKIDLNQTFSKQALDVTPTKEHLKQHDLKAVLLNLIATITTLPNTANTQTTQPILNLTGFDKLLKALVTPGASTKEAITHQERALDHIKTLANNVLNRISTNQLLSLSKSQSQNEPTTQTIVNLDIPIKVGDQCLPLHMQIEERRSEQDNDNDNKHGSSEEKDDKKSLKSRWHVILEFSFLEQGDFYSDVTIYGDILKSTLWAENPDIRQELDMCLHKLEAQLVAQGIVVEELRTVKNKPIGSTNQIQHHLVDIKT